jgi:hypothetical protein
MPGDSGVLVVTRVRSTLPSAHEAAGATGIRRSPRPLGRTIQQSLGRIAPRDRERASGFFVIASAAKQSILPRKERMDCFVASLLAMTVLHMNCRGCLKIESEARMNEAIFGNERDAASA